MRLSIEMNINKNVCIGLVISGLLQHFDRGEVLRDKHLSGIASKLEKKLSNFRNGTDSFRHKAIMAFNKQKKSKKDIELIEKAKYMNKLYLTHVEISNHTWIEAQKKIGTTEITTTDLIIQLLNKHESAKKYFSFSNEFLKSYSESSTHKGKNIFRSLKVANLLLNTLDVEISYHNYNSKVA